MNEDEVFNVDDEREVATLRIYERVIELDPSDPTADTLIDNAIKLEKISIDKRKLAIEKEATEAKLLQEKEAAERKIKSESRHKWAETGLKALGMVAYAGALIWTTTLGYKFESNSNIYKSPTFKDTRNMFKRNPFK